MIDIDLALERFAEAPSEAPRVEGVPDHELTRSVAALRVGAAAQREGLLLFHFEHRAGMDVPESWQRGAGERPTWSQGVLPEPKYGAFRHDVGVGSFHPGHRAKWSTHELCHGLIGTAWQPDASPLFHATAGRLAELVPVVLWYFLDEIGLRRCARHRDPLFRTHCGACEQAACSGRGELDAARARRRLQGAVDFMEQELAAVQATLRDGVPVHHVHGSLDLCSDGLAYAASHGARLGSRGFAAWAERYLGPATGGYGSLDDLRERVVEVFGYVATGAPLPSRGGRRQDWVRQDVAGRVLQGLHGDAGACTAVWDRLDGDDLEGAIHAYAEASDAVGGEHPADVFAPGYDLLEGVGRAVDQLDEGLRTVVPMTLQLAEDAGIDLVEPFAAADGAARVPLGLRFADWVVDHASPHVAALARYEAQLRAAAGQRDLVALGPGEGLRWSEGVQRWSGAFDPVTWAEWIELGRVEGRCPDGRLDAEPPPEELTHLVLGRDGDGGLLLVSVPSVDPHDLDVSARDELLSMGLLRPERWPV